MRDRYKRDRDGTLLVTSEIIFQIFCEGCIAGDIFTDEVMGQGPFGEQDDVVLAFLFDLRQVRENAEHPDGGVLDDDGLAGSAEAHLGHLFVAVGLFAADFVHGILVQHMVDDISGEVRAVDDVALYVVITLQQLHLALFDVGLEDLGDIIEIAGRTMDDIGDGAFDDFVFEHGLRVEQRDFFRAGLFAGDDGDVGEMRHFGSDCLVVEVQVALVVDVIGGDDGRRRGQAHGGNDHIDAVADALEGLGVGRVDRLEGVLAFETVVFLLLEVGSDDFMTAVDKDFQNLETEITKSTSQ